MSGIAKRFKNMKELDTEINGSNKEPHKIMKNRSIVITNRLTPLEVNIINTVVKKSKYKMRESLLLDNIIIKNYSKNDIITQENGEWKYLSIILTGCVSLYTQKDGYIGQLTEKQWFCNIKQNIARGTITCMEDTKLACIPYTYFITSSKSVDEKDIFIKNKDRPQRLEDILFVPDRIGNGGFADVYKCKINDNRYAVKCIKKTVIQETKSHKQLLDEIKVLQMIEHPQVLDYINVLQDNKNIYIITELIVCGDFFDYLTTHTLSEMDAMFYTANIIVILEYLHNQDIVYRDLKPENMVFMDNGYIKLIDFGFAKCLKSGEKTKTILGTPEYIAPEIMSGNGYGKPVDWWALGIFTYELLYMDVPFGGDIYQLEKRVKQGIFYPNKFSLDSNDFIDKLLHYQPNERLTKKNIKSHRWFIQNNFNWNKLFQYTHKPSYIPPKKKFSSLYIKYNELDKSK